MKIDYFFPVFNKDDAKGVLENFFKTEFFKKNKENKIIVCCNNKDEQNLTYLKSKSKNNKKFKLLILDNEFTYNDAFYYAVDNFDGDVVLLGDCKIERNDLVFASCLEKYNKGASLVHIFKRHKGIKVFFANIFSGAYNFFIKIFTNKRDRLNVISLGLISKDIVDLLKVLPKKRCFLKNTKDLIGYESRTVYIDGKTKTYKPNFKKATGSLITSIVAGSINILSLFLIILLNCLTSIPTAVNIVLGSAIILSVILVALFLPKHFFDIRNYPTKNLKYNIKQIN